MARITAADAAVAILRREGVTNVFGLPGAAINPFYAAMRRDGGIRHTLARHVEGASHMAEGYTRARAGNIGVCVGTSGPAGTDMLTGLYSAAADSIPILCITGQAPVAKLHKEDFQAVNISAIAAPLTKMAMTVLEPAQVPGAFGQAFHLMRSGRPGPVLIDLPFDVQLAEIDFDLDTYEPLPVYKPSATRAQIAKALDMLAAAERPIIVAGGGIINADAADLLVEFAELIDTPVVPTLMGWGALPDDHRLMAGMAGLQTSHRYGNATLLASDFVLGIGNPVGKPAHRRLATYTKGRTFVHVDTEPTQIGRVFAPDYSIVSDAGQPAAVRRQGARRGAAARTHGWSSSAAPTATMQRRCTTTTCRQAAPGVRGDEPGFDGDRYVRTIGAVQPRRGQVLTCRRHGAGPAEPHPPGLRSQSARPASRHPTHLLGLSATMESFITRTCASPAARPGCAGEERGPRLGEVPQGLLLHHLGALSQPRIRGAGGGERLARPGSPEHLSAPVPVPVLLDGQDPHVPRWPQCCRARPPGRGWGAAGTGTYQHTIDHH